MDVIVDVVVVAVVAAVVAVVAVVVCPEQCIPRQNIFNELWSLQLFKILSSNCGCYC